MKSSFIELLIKYLYYHLLSLLQPLPLWHLTPSKNPLLIFHQPFILLSTLLTLGNLETSKLFRNSKNNLRLDNTSKLPTILIKVLPPTAKITPGKAKSCPKSKEKTQDKPTQSLSTLFSEFSNHYKFKNLILFNKSSRNHKWTPFSDENWKQSLITI